MADIVAFKTKVDELLTLSRKNQKDLAAVTGYASATLNRLLHKPDLKCDLVELIVMKMAELGAVTFRRDAIELLMLMDCEAGAETGQLAELLNKLKPDPSPSLNRQEESALLLKKYLERLSQHAQFATLPILPSNSYPFRTSFNRSSCVRTRLHRKTSPSGSAGHCSTNPPEGSMIRVVSCASKSRVVCS